MDESKSNSENAKAKMLEALAKKKKEARAEKPAGLHQAQRLVLGRLVALHQKCIDVNLALRRISTTIWALPIKSTFCCLHSHIY